MQYENYRSEWRANRDLAFGVQSTSGPMATRRKPLVQRDTGFIDMVIDTIVQVVTVTCLVGVLIVMLVGILLLAP